jgi:chorismate synthase
MLKLLTAGESHGRALVGILEGLPAGLRVDIKKINHELRRRQQGPGRGKRMKMEQDKVQIISGLKNRYTLGSPIAVLIENRDYSIDKLPALTCPRPGHGDLPGGLKYGFCDLRNTLERASARETAVRVAIGAICKIFLAEFAIAISSKIVSIGGQTKKKEILRKITEAQGRKDTLGGIFEVVVKGLPIGLGSYVHWQRRLDSRLAGIMMSIPAVKAVEFGLGFSCADKFGSSVHDAIYYSKNKGYFRLSNNAGGLEAGVTNGQPLIIRACMKPISTLMAPLDSVDILTHKPAQAAVERSDTCAVEAAGVIGESVCAYVLADVFLEKFGSDSLKDIKQAYKNYLKRLR